jgi:hypothetical protein
MGDTVLENTLSTSMYRHAPVLDFPHFPGLLWLPLCVVLHSHRRQNYRQSVRA